MNNQPAVTFSPPLLASTPTSVYQRRPYLVYVEFLQAIVTALAQVTTVVLMSHLLYCSICNRKRLRSKQGLLATLYIYLLTHVIEASLSLPYNIYLIALWNPTVNNYSPYVLYPLGIVFGTYTAISAIPVFFLTLDRCIALLTSVRPRLHFLNSYVAVGAAVTVFGVTAGQLASTVILDLPLETGIGCRNFVCLMEKTRSLQYTTCKSTVEAMNLALSFYLFYTLSKMSCSQTSRIVRLLLSNLFSYVLCFRKIAWFASQY